MNYLEIRSYGKINFTLDIKNRRSDGYHNIESMIQTIDIYDTLRVTKIENGIQIISDHHYLPLDKRNLIYKAYKELSLYTEKILGAQVEIQKHIPISAGLGGGSSNAAAMLIALNKLYNLNLTKEELAHIAENIGMDVVFFIYGGLKYIHGKGEKVEELGILPFDIWIVIAKPPVGISTVWAYNRFDILKEREKKNYTKCALKSLKERNLKKFLRCLGNDFTYLLEESYPEILKIKKELQMQDLKYINISGSGPTIFGIVESKEKGEIAVKKLRETGYFAQIVKPIPYSFEITKEEVLIYEDTYRVGV